MLRFSQFKGVSTKKLYFIKFCAVKIFRSNAMPWIDISHGTFYMIFIVEYTASPLIRTWSLYFMGEKSVFAGLVLLIFGVLAGLISYTTIDAGHIGIVKRFGAVTGETFGPGLHWKIPFLESVDVIDARISSVNADVNAGSRDQQEVKAQVSVQYFLNQVVTPVMVDSLGDREALEIAIISNAIQESVKAVTAQYTAEELLTKRPEVKIGVNQAVETYIATALSEKKLDGLVRIANIGVQNIEFSDEFNRAIEAKVKAQQEAQQALASKKKRITEAEAENEEKKLRADAEAYRVTQEAAARAAAIEQEGQALRNNPHIVQLRLAEKWDGILPRINSGVVPFLSLDQKDFERQPAAQ